MKNKLIASAILVIFGSAFLFVAYQFAPLAYTAPSSSSPGSGAPTILEWAYGVPAALFTLAGTLGIISGVVIASLTLFGVERIDP